MVMNIGALRGGEYGIVEADIRSVASVRHERGAIVKVILETALLDDDQKALACALARQAGADFVKTSTGFAQDGRDGSRCRADAADGRALIWASRRRAASARSKI